MSKISAVLSASIVIPSGRTTVATLACPVMYPTVLTRTACEVQIGRGGPAGRRRPGNSDEQPAPTKPQASTKKPVDRRTTQTLPRAKDKIATPITGAPRDATFKGQHAATHLTRAPGRSGVARAGRARRQAVHAAATLATGAGTCRSRLSCRRWFAAGADRPGRTVGAAPPDRPGGAVLPAVPPLPALPLVPAAPFVPRPRRSRRPRWCRRVRRRLRAAGPHRRRCLPVPNVPAVPKVPAGPGLVPASPGLPFVPPVPDFVAAESQVPAAAARCPSVAATGPGCVAPPVLAAGRPGLYRVGGVAGAAVRRCRLSRWPTGYRRCRRPCRCRRRR